jgi:hypothetical protein
MWDFTVYSHETGMDVMFVEDAVSESLGDVGTIPY